MKSEGSARIDAPFAVVCMLIFSTLLLALDFLYQLAQIAVRYIANFGLVINGHQRNGNIILRLLHIICDDSSTTAFTLALRSNGHTIHVSTVAQQGTTKRILLEFVEKGIVVVNKRAVFLGQCFGSTLELRLIIASNHYANRLRAFIRA